MSDAPEAQKPTSTVKKVTISSLVASIPALWIVMEAHDAHYDTRYVLQTEKTHYDARYVLKTEAITIAEASDIKSQLKTASNMATENSSKLDLLLLDQARNNVWAAEDRVARLRAAGAPDEDIRDAERRLKSSREYYQCLTGHGTDCGRLRGI